MPAADLFISSRFSALAATHREPSNDAAALLVNQIAALVLLILLSPLMIVIAGLIWSRGGPVFFTHYRVGRNGKMFRCLKFRSMLNDADRLLADHLRDNPTAQGEWERDQKLTHDPRITMFGQFLRRSSLDELPQLINVVRGEMALVGPRPITFDELTRYGIVRWHYLSVRPGITGLWQVSGRNNTTYEERVELDRQYVEQRSVMTDIVILLQTVRVVVWREGAR